jgi:hypothetical protein
MGRIDSARSAFAARRMEAADFIWIAALGTAARGPATTQDICAAIDDIAGHLWTPVFDVVIGCIAEMTRGGRLCRVAGDAFVTTASGRNALGLLLAHPVNHPACPLAQVGLRFKLAFLDLAPAERRRDCVDQAVAAYETALAAGRDRPRPTGAFDRLWRDNDDLRFTRELATLKSIAAACAPD